MAASTEGMKNGLVNGTKTKQKASKNMMRRAKKKESRARGEASTRESSVVTVSEDESQQVGCHQYDVSCASGSRAFKAKSVQEPSSPPSLADVEPVIDVDENDPMYAEFKSIFDRFKPGEAVGAFYSCLHLETSLQK